MNEPEEISLVTILLGMRKVLGYGFAALVKTKGLEDRAAVSMLAQGFLEAGLTGDIRLRSDGEASVRAVALEVAARRAPAQTIVEVTPRGSSSSLVAAERFAETLAGLNRTYRLALEKRWGVTVAAVDPVFPFLAQFATFVYNRCHVRNVGSTPFGQVQRAYTSRLLPFGTPALVRRADALKWPKLEKRWLEGVWVGRRAVVEHVVATSDGLVASRTCRVLALSGPEDMLRVVRAVNWGEVPLRTMSAAQGIPVPTSQRPKGRTDIRELREFQREPGRTPGCAACRLGARNRAHTVACRTLRREWLATRELESHEKRPHEEDGGESRLEPIGTRRRLIRRQTASERRSARVGD